MKTLLEHAQELIKGSWWRNGTRVFLAENAWDSFVDRVERESVGSQSQEISGSGVEPGPVAVDVGEGYRELFKGKDDLCATDEFAGSQGVRWYEIGGFEPVFVQGNRYRRKLDREAPEIQLSPATCSMGDASDSRETEVPAVSEWEKVTLSIVEVCEKIERNLSLFGEVVKVHESRLSALEKPVSESWEAGVSQDNSRLYIYVPPQWGLKCWDRVRITPIVEDEGVS